MLLARSDIMLVESPFLPEVVILLTLRPCCDFVLVIGVEAMREGGVDVENGKHHLLGLYDISM